MTENEALKTMDTEREIDRLISYIGSCLKSNIDCTVTIGKTKTHGIAKALTEIQQYCKLGTVEEVREAVEKQQPKKPDYKGDGYIDGQMVYDTWICPRCGTKYEVDYDDYKFCPECGQRLDLEGWQ